MGRTFEKTLPRGYRRVLTIDVQRDRRLMLRLLIASMTIKLIGAALSILTNLGQLSGPFPWQRLALWVLACAVYTVLHELTHGAVYLLCTGQRPRFGLVTGAAYCGVPDILVYRSTSLLALVAPLIVFTVLLTVPIVLLTDPWDRMLAGLLMTFHLSGCIGDIHDLLLLLTRFRDPRLLVKDLGPRQLFFAPAEPSDRA